MQIRWISTTHAYLTSFFLFSFTRTRIWTACVYIKTLYISIHAHTCLYTVAEALRICGLRNHVSPIVACYSRPYSNCCLVSIFSGQKVISVKCNALYFRLIVPFEYAWPLLSGGRSLGNSMVFQYLWRSNPPKSFKVNTIRLQTIPRSTKVMPKLFLFLYLCSSKMAITIRNSLKRQTTNNINRANGEFPNAPHLDWPKKWLNKNCESKRCLFHTCMWFDWCKGFLILFCGVWLIVYNAFHFNIIIHMSTPCR